VRDAREIVRDGYDAIAPEYERWAASFRSPVLATLGRLLALLEPGAHVLDLGCGNGLPVARALLDGGHRVTGVDLSAGQLERARRNVPEAELVHADALEVDLPAAAYDGAVSAFVFGHVPRGLHLPLLRRLHEWLRPGAPALISFGLSDTEWELDDDWLGAPMFFSSYPPETSRRLLADAGFSLEWDRRIGQDEPGHGDSSFLWTLSRRLP
jgi:cyclopropane fatty-acyl-phospholipid synthase-like methyltransferase